MRLLIIGLTFFFLTTDLCACSCGRVGIVKNKKTNAYVFKGRVIKIKESITTDIITGTSKAVEYRRTTYTFEVLRSYKGLNHKETVDLVTGSMTDCGVDFDLNKVYIVYAYIDDRKAHYQLVDQKTAPYITTHLCTRTKKRTELTFWETFVLRLAGESN